jgi:hypothetical protein
MIEAITGEPIPLATIYNAANTVVAVVDLLHVAGGLYRALHTPANAGHYCVQYVIFSDAGRTVISIGFERTSETMLVRGTNPDIAFSRILGHLGENVRDDVLSYDPNNRPLLIRRRIFASKAVAEASTIGGLGEGEICVITGTAEHFDALKWESLLRVKE